MLAGKYKEYGIRREIVHILPEHGRQIQPHPRPVQLNNIRFCPVVNFYLAGARNIDQNKGGFSIRVSSADYRRIASVDIKYPPDLKGNVNSPALRDNQISPLVAEFSEFYDSVLILNIHLCFLCKFQPARFPRTAPKTHSML